jgi:protein O-mannosyl-transferase
LKHRRQIVKPFCSDPASQRKATLVVCLLLALLTAAVYWPVARNGFINFDDPDYISGNPPVLAGLTLGGAQWAFTSMHSSNWHPLTWLSHMLDCQIYGLKPGGHHVTSLLLHIADTLLLFCVLKRMTGACWRSALVAALFALHPLHVESVAWVSERKDVLSMFFFLLTLGAYVRYADKSRVSSLKSKVQGPLPSAAEHAPRTPQHAARLSSSVFYLLALLFFAFGLMSKPMLVTLPFVLLLLDYWPLKRVTSGGWRVARAVSPGTCQPWRLIWEKIPFFALAAASCVVTFLVQRASGAMPSLARSPLEVRLANGVIAYVRYLGKTLWPSKLAVFYPWTPFESWEVPAAALLLVIVTVGLFLAAKKQPALLIGWLWFLGTLVPVIGLVQVGKQSLADRYTYLPHIGLFIALVWGAAALVDRLKWPRLVSMAAAGLLLAGCGIVSFQQVSYWRSSRTLFGHALAVTSRNFVAYAVFANVLVEEGKLTEAIEQCRKSLEIAPEYPEAHNTLGNIYAKLEKADEALASYRAAAEGDPTYPDPRIGMAEVLLKQGKLAEAEAKCREALQLAPTHLPTLFCLATALHRQGKLDEAADYYHRILKLQPELYTPHRALGNVFVAQGKPDQAIAEFQLALKARPQDADTHVVLGVVLLQKDRVEDATAQFSEATRLQPTNAIAHYQLALIHQGRKETKAAIDSYHQALKAQPDWPESLNNLAWVLAANPDASLRNGAEAVTLAERACKLTNYKEPILVGTLAAAYAEAGRFSEAVSSAEKARTLALAAGQKEIVQRNTGLLELYRAGRPYHERQ